MARPLGAGSGVEVSVVMPVCDAGERWLTAAVDSVLAQRGDVRFELVVCDDGSHGRARTLLNRLLARVRDGGVDVGVVRHGSTLGPSAARNSAVQLARGRYLLWLDSDDELAPGTVHRLVQRADETGAPMVVSRCLVRELDGTLAERDPAPYLDLARRHRRTVFDPLAQVVFSVQAQLVHRETFHRVGGFDQEFRWAEVTEFFLRFAHHVGIEGIALLPEVGYVYNRRPGSQSSSREEHDRYRRRAMRAYCRQAIPELGEGQADAAYLGRSPVTGAQHYRLLTSEGVVVPPYLEDFLPRPQVPARSPAPGGRPAAAVAGAGPERTARQARSGRDRRA